MDKLTPSAAMVRELKDAVTPAISLPAACGDANSSCIPRRDRDREAEQRRMQRTRYLIFFGALALATVLPAAANAATATVTGTLTGGTLSVTTAAAPTFSANLESGDSTPTYTVPLTSTDTRGTGAGWNETITSTQFTTGGATPDTLATNASSLTGITSVCASGTCTNPTNAITYPVAVPAAATPPTAVKFFNAAANTGMGKFTTTPTIGVFVPQSSFAGTYTSTLTIAIVSGP